MSTNYYLRYNICKCCKRYDTVHLGKSSCGWKFLFHNFTKTFPINEWSNNTIEMLRDNINVDITIKNYNDLIKFLEEYIFSGNVKIYDEYDNCISLIRFKNIIKNAQTLQSHVEYHIEKLYGSQFGSQPFRDNEGYEFTSGDFC